MQGNKIKTILENWLIVEFNKYLTDRPHNEEILIKLFEVTKSLLKAPTGSGKTFTLIKIAKEVAKRTGKKIIIAVPKKKQAEQIEKEYNIPAVTGDTKQLLNDSRVIACVYDSLPKVFTLKDWIIDHDTTVIIDESHRMRYDSTFRHNALRRMNNIIKNTNLIYISATTKIVEDIKFECKIECKTSNTNYNYNACYFYDYTTTTELALLGLVNHLNMLDNVTNNNTEIIVFWDNKQKLETVKTIFEGYGLKTELLTSETKEEEAMQTLVITSKLTGAKIYLCTSVIEEGINIKNKNKFACVYVMDNTTNYDSIEQACARLRTDGHECYIMRKEKDENVNGNKILFNIDLKIEEATKKVEGINQAYHLLKATGIEEENILKSFDGLSKNKEYIYNSESDSWELDKDRLIRGLTLEKDKTISKNTTLHRNEIKQRVKAREFIEFKEEYIRTTKQQHELIKEIKGEQAEVKQEKRKSLLEHINNMSEQAFITFEEILVSTGTNIGIKGVPISEEEKTVIKAIRDNKDIFTICKQLNALKMDIKGAITEFEGDYKELNTHVRRCQYKNYNKIHSMKIAIDFLDLEEENAAQYYKIRKLGDKLVGKTVSEETLKKIYKIKNPNLKKGQDLNNKQRNIAINLIGEVYKVYAKTNGQIKLGNLLK